MRYGAIAPIIAGLDERYPSKTAFYTEISAKGLMGPDGKLHHYAPATIEKWYLDYQNHGFEGLVPKGRSDAGMSRKLDEELQERIRYFKTNYPRMSAAAIYRQLKSDGSVINGQVSESTVSRFVKRLQSELRQTPNKDMRRYERPHINEVWCGDSSVGPRLTDSDGKKHRIYIIALIDDASRFITGIDVFYNDNFINLMSVMRSAIAKYGRPKVFNFDNGKSYKNRQMELLAARIGTTLSYCQPYTPTGKAKIERWFRTMKDQWMAALDMRDFHSLEELRGSLYAFVQQYNQSPHSSLRGLSPQDRFFSEPEQIRRLSEEDIHQNFLLEIERRVSADSVIVIDQIEYEVDYRFARQRIRLRYSPDMKEIFIVETDGMLTPIRLLNKTENALIKRKKYAYAKETNDYGLHCKIRNGLEFNPFLKNSKEVLVETQEYKEVLFRLNYLLTTKGFGLLTGSAGRGKTTAVRNWASGLNTSLYKVMYSSLSTLTVNDFYRNLATELGAQPAFRKTDNFKIIQDEINRLVLEKRQTPVIIIDEANYIGNAVLNDLKMLFNFEMDSKDRAVVLLSGLPQLNSTLRL